MGLRIRLVCLIVLFVSLFTHGFAEGAIHGLLEYDYFDADSTTKNKQTGDKTDSEFTRTSQLYKLDMNRFLYPNLYFAGGASFELINSDSTSDGTDFDSERNILRPYLELVLKTPLYDIGGDYRRTERKDSSGSLPTIKEYTDQYHGLLNWRPADLPRIRFDYFNRHFHDDPKTTDVVDETIYANARYNYETLNVLYSYTRSDTKNREDDFTTLIQTHNARVNYSKAFFDRKVTLGGGYNFMYSTSEFAGQGSGFSSLPRSGGLYSLDDDLGLALQSNSNLIDNVVDVSAGIDIGLDADETKRTSIGIDFGLPVTVDTIFLWVDRSLSSTVANSFVWEVYTSPDNTDASVWTLRTIVSPTPFGQVKNRFEIPIPPVETRFIKVVTRPLVAVPSVPDAGDYPNIFVTEIEGLVTVSGIERPTFTSYDHTVNFLASWNITQRTALGYTSSYKYTESDPGGSETIRFFNGLSFRHIFNRTFTGTAQASRTDSKRGKINSISYAYSASLKASWLETFTQTLTYSGTTDEEEGETGNNNSVVLRNSAELYHNWSAYADLGHNWGKPRGESDNAQTTFTRIGTRISPHRRVVLDGSYAAVWDKHAGQGTRLSQNGEGHIFVLPFDTLSLSYDYSVFITEGRDTREFHGFSASWSPFRDGTLQLGASYRQTMNSEGLDTVAYGPHANWRIVSWAVLDVRYTHGETDSDLEETDTNSFRGKLRLYF